ncbi:hypothetical protein LP420_23030 [Massilia sp. B-10]|nr:hypothetical protein LP420_23030 [Massilia sp. B-10]
MMPNVLQYPIAIAAILRASLHRRQCQSPVYPARTRTPAQRFGQRSDHRA